MCYSKPLEGWGKAGALGRLEVLVGGEGGGGFTLSFGEGGVRWLCCETERHLFNLALCISNAE